MAGANHTACVGSMPSPGQHAAQILYVHCSRVPLTHAKFEPDGSGIARPAAQFPRIQHVVARFGNGGRWDAEPRGCRLRAKRVQTWSKLPEGVVPIRLLPGIRWPARATQHTNPFLPPCTRPNVGPVRAQLNLLAKLGAGDPSPSAPIAAQNSERPSLRTSGGSQANPQIDLRETPRADLPRPRAPRAGLSAPRSRPW